MPFTLKKTKKFKEICGPYIGPYTPLILQNVFKASLALREPQTIKQMH